VATGSAPLAYQWRLNGVPLTGATAATFTLTSARAEDAGAYSVTVSNAYGSLTSPPANLLVLQIPPIITRQPVAATLLPGQPALFRVEASGTPPLSYQWTKSGDDIANATTSSFAISSVQLADAGIYRCIVKNPVGEAFSEPAILTVPSTSRLANISLLAPISAPGEGFTLGFVVSAAATNRPLPVVVRAVGPSLSPLGVPGALDDPKLELFVGAQKIAENDNWGGSAELSEAFGAVGAFAFEGVTSRDAAILANLAGSDHSARVSATGKTIGTVLAELYDATPVESYDPTGRRLVNASVLREMGTGFTMGFVLGGVGSRRLLIRAVGPGLVPLGVAGAAANPRVSLFRAGTSTPIEGNDDWGGATGLAEVFASVGAFALPPGSKDSALIATLPPGSYTAQVSGVDNTTGIALAEVYEVP
jgi:hypothetical protein